ncbi:hypothetical protein EZS27_031696 [termite gut metagenome]|uniref:Uncharacterized protein n=1 Tax=termite gut metagenome TaxID=433724 RepID=A0A5J4Q8B8_9ZZZZ
MSRADTYKELIDACKYDEADKLKKEALDEAREYLRHGMHFGEAMQKAGFEENDEPLSILDEDILKGREKKLFFPNIPPFEYIQPMKNAERIDKSLKCKGYDISVEGHLLSYRGELEQHKVDIFLDNFDIGLEKTFSLVKNFCVTISNNTERPSFLKNAIIGLCKILDKKGGRGIVSQFLMLYGLLSWFKSNEHTFSTAERNEAYYLYEWIRNRFEDVFIFYFNTFRHDSDSAPLDNLLRFIVEKGQARHQSDTSVQQSDSVEPQRVINTDELGSYFKNSFKGGGYGSINHFNTLIKELRTNRTAKEFAQIALLAYEGGKMNSRRPVDFTEWHKIFCACVGCEYVEYKPNKLRNPRKSIKELFNYLY